MRLLLPPIFLCLTLAISVTAETPQTETKSDQPTRRLRANDVFDLTKTLIFQDNFTSGVLDRWKFSENDQYELPAPSPERIAIADAPGFPHRKKAVRFAVRRAPGSFRSEIALPSEKGFQERWYAARVLIPDDWIFDTDPAADIVMQWHAVPGNWRPTYPNLEISVSNDRWNIRQSYGDPKTEPNRNSVKLDAPVQRGVWVSWVIHAKWSPTEDGMLQIWRDGKLVFERKGPNVYGTIGMDYTPYFKTGIYRPEWRLDQFEKATAQDKDRPVANHKIVYVTDIKIGNERVTFNDVAPPIIPPRSAEADESGRISPTTPPPLPGHESANQTPPD